MTTAPAEKFEERRRKASIARPFYASGSLALTARDAGHVNVDIVLRPGTTDAVLLESKVVRGALKGAAQEYIGRIFAAEIEQVVVAYRLMLRESLAKAEDPELQSALNRARLQEKLLAGTSMADQAQACELLGLSTANPSATLKRKEDRREILRFTMDGRAVYPLFQFDVEGRRLFPAVAQLLARKPKGWSDLRLLHWLTRPHLDMGGTPGGSLGDGETVLAAFEREIEPPVHG